MVTYSTESSDLNQYRLSSIQEQNFRKQYMSADAVDLSSKKAIRIAVFAVERTIGVRNMAKQRHLNKNQILQNRAAFEQSVLASQKVNFLVTLIILNDIFDFDDVQLNLFADKYRELLDLYNRPGADMNMQEWIKYFIDYAGIDCRIVRNEIDPCGNYGEGGRK